VRHARLFFARRCCCLRVKQILLSGTISHFVWKYKKYLRVAIVYACMGKGGEIASHGTTRQNKSEMKRLEMHRSLPQKKQYVCSVQCIYAMAFCICRTNLLQDTVIKRVSLLHFSIPIPCIHTRLWGGVWSRHPCNAVYGPNCPASHLERRTSVL
jgi:hypothetical protein